MLKKTGDIRLSFFEAFIGINFITATGLLIFGMFGIFNRASIIALIFILVLLICKSRYFIHGVGNYVWIYLLIPITALGFMLLRGFFIGDVYYHWLPFARAITTSGTLPDFVNFNWFSVMPYQSLLFAATFSLFGTLNQFANIWVPFLFCASTLILLLRWGREWGFSKDYQIFIAILFLSNAGLQFFGSWNLMQEPLVLFFSTAFFYFFHRFYDSHKIRDLVFVLASLSLAVFSKFNAIFFLLFLVPLFFQNKHKKLFFSLSLVLFAHVIFWFIRNYVVYGNPFFPILNSFFSGQYSQWYNQIFDYAHHNFSPYPTLGSRFKFILSGLLEEYPYILLALYGLIKRRSYWILGIIVGFFVTKELLLFSSTSGVRYYYPLFGLILIYSFLGLNILKSKIVLSGLVGLATFQLLGIPPVNSGSAFISRFEQWLEPILPIINFGHDKRLLIAVLVFGLSFLIKDLSVLKRTLLYLYSLFILKIKFIANKSFLNVYGGIGTGIVYYLASFFQRFKKHQTKIAIVAIAVVIFINSWIMGVAYYINQGGFEFPVQHIWQNSIWSRGILDKDVGNGDKNNFYVLIFSNRDYFSWFTEYKAVVYTDFDFHALTKKYDKSMSAEDTQKLFEQSKIKYVLINALNNDLDYTDFKTFGDRVRFSGEFELVARSQEGYEVWKVY